MISRHAVSRVVLCSVLTLLMLGTTGAYASAAVPMFLIPPFMRQTGRLYAPSGQTGDDFGFSVAIDRDTAVVGAPQAHGGEGAVYVFVRSGFNWTFWEELPADPAVGDEFGHSVAVEGDFIAVGMPGDDTTVGGADSGSVVVYERGATGWSYLTGFTQDFFSPNSRFGASVDVSGDRLVVGAPGDSESGEKAGIAYVFSRDEVSDDYLYDPDYKPFDEFGTSVAISGNHIAVGIPSDNLGMESEQGSVVMFEWDSADWADQPKTYATAGDQDDRFGWSVSLSGTTALIGAPGTGTAAGSEAGQAHVYVRGASGWAVQQTLSASDAEPYARFGHSAAVDGDLALVGANMADGYDGAAYVFSRAGTSWTERQKLAPAAVDGGNYAYSVALSQGTALVGALMGDGAQTDAGVVYVYARQDPVYRFYNKRNGSHFYTPNAAERNHVIATWPTIYTYEGIAYWVNPFNNTQPLYRFYNKRNGSHFYTASEAERDSVIANLSATYSYDGPTYRVTPVVIPETTLPPVWRFYNKRNGSHFYTANKAEFDSVVANLSATYTYEGIGFWLGQ